MRLVFWAQIQRDHTKDHALQVIKTTKHRPTASDGMVLKFDIEVPEAVFEPIVKASLVSLETVTEQARQELKVSLKR